MCTDLWPRAELYLGQREFTRVHLPSRGSGRFSPTGAKEALALQIAPIAIAAF
jgi:hypothetical protein